jgi:hypothetical protein
MWGSVRVCLGVVLLLLMGDGAQAKRKPKPVAAPVVIVDKAAQEAARAQVIAEQPGFIAELAQVDAEVQVAVALYQTGHIDLAQVHMRHTDAIIYRRLQSRMAARRASSFATEFNAISKAFAAKESFKSIQAKYKKLRVAMTISRGAGDLISAHPMATGVLILIQKSNDYYSSGVANGQVVDAHHYQDGWGLLKAAKNIMEDVSRKDRKIFAAPLQQIDDALRNLNDLWPNLTGEDTKGQDGQVLIDAVAKVEQAVTAIQ